jgi:hypothetical protein
LRYGYHGATARQRQPRHASKRIAISHVVALFGTHGNLPAEEAVFDPSLHWDISFSRSKVGQQHRPHSVVTL